MSEFEIISLTQEMARTITEQFNFWMATTFALVIATYTAGHRLTLSLRIAIAVLYMAACMIYFLRYLDAIEQVVQLTDMLEQTGSTYSLRNVSLVSYVRRFVMLAGTVLAVLIIFKPHFGATATTDTNDV